MRRMFAVGSFVVWVLGAVACGSDDDAVPDVPACNEQAEAYRQHLASCCTSWSTEQVDQEVEAHRTACAQRHAIDGTAVNEAKRDECLTLQRQGWEECTELAVEHLADHVCNTWLEGQLGEGASCHSGQPEVCAAGLYCWPVSCNGSGGTPFVCTRPPADGAACTCGWCGDGQYCSNGVCVAEGSVGSGEDCSGYDGSFPTTPCVDGHYCRGGVCVPLPGEGETCEGWCAEGSACVNGTCEHPAGSGQTCVEDSECPSGNCFGGECMVADMCVIAL